MDARRRRWRLLALVLALAAAVDTVQAATAFSDASSSSVTEVRVVDADILATPRASPFQRSLPTHEPPSSTSKSTADSDGPASEGLSSGAIAGVAVGCAAIVGVAVAVAARGRFTARKGEEALFADMGDENGYFSDYAAM